MYVVYRQLVNLSTGFLCNWRIFLRFFQKSFCRAKTKKDQENKLINAHIVNDSVWRIVRPHGKPACQSPGRVFLSRALVCYCRREPGPMPGPGSRGTVRWNLRLNVSIISEAISSYRSGTAPCWTFKRRCASSRFPASALIQA